MAIEFQAEDVPSGLSLAISLNLFRIAQESLRNVGKHSHARNVRIELQGGGGHLVLRISDDGVGFSPGLRSLHAGLGMVSMRERLKLVGGELNVRSTEPGGTVVEARVPVPPPQDKANQGRASLPGKRPSVGQKGGDEKPAGKGGVDGVYQVRPHS
jgi:signal transduction histidine kinase